MSELCVATLFSMFRNISQMKAQQMSLGLQFDWDKVCDVCDDVMCVMV